MSFLDSDYIQQLSDTALDKLGLGSGAAAVATVGKAYNDSKASSSVTQTAAASQSAPAYSSQMILGMDPKQLVLIAVALVVGSLLLKRLK